MWVDRLNTLHKLLKIANVFYPAPIEGEDYIQFVNISNGVSDGFVTLTDDECTQTVYVNAADGGVPFGAATQTHFHVSIATVNLIQ